jgi:nitronate monooxygenase
MSALPRDLDDLAPVFVAPMAGGPSNPTLVATAARSGYLGQLAGGYLSAAELAHQIEQTRRAGASTFGVNLFVPNPNPIGATDYRAYADRLRPLARRLGAVLPTEPVEDDDDWKAKLDLLLHDPTPVVSFTFGLPEPRTVQRLRASGSFTLQTVTSAAEARLAVETGVDALIVQANSAGGHSGVLDPRLTPADTPLPQLVRDVLDAVALPVIATGGIAERASVTQALQAGAVAVSVGTVLLRAPESGASAVHKNALADPRYDRTVLTRAFTGRIARALVNGFTSTHDNEAPIGYPALHHLTRPIRTAATRAGDGSSVNLWAGLGWRHAREQPVAETLRNLTP